MVELAFHDCKIRLLTLRQMLKSTGKILKRLQRIQTVKRPGVSERQSRLLTGLLVDRRDRKVMK